jgi:hypothetical protein
MDHEWSGPGAWPVYPAGVPGLSAVVGDIVNQSLVFLRGNGKNDIRRHEKGFGY